MIFLRWYDFWIGAYYDKEAGDLYICPVPMLGICIHLPWVRRSRTYAVRSAQVEKEQEELLKIWGLRMANAELQRDQAYDMISSMLFLRHHHWPLTVEEKTLLLPHTMHKTLEQVEKWKREQMKEAFKR